MFSTTYTPASVTSPYAKFVVNRGQVVLPTDIGVRTVVIEIKSALYHPAVTAVNFSFKITVACTVSSFAIQTTVIPFGYVLNSGNVYKSTFQPVMTNNCMWPTTYSVAHYSNGVYVDQQDAMFDPVAWMYTFAYTNPALIGTV